MAHPVVGFAQFSAILRQNPMQRVRAAPAPAGPSLSGRLMHHSVRHHRRPARSHRRSGGTCAMTRKRSCRHCGQG
jgi:hypothetical protein